MIKRLSTLLRPLLGSLTLQLLTVKGGRYLILIIASLRLHTLLRPQVRRTNNLMRSEIEI